MPVLFSFFYYLLLLGIAVFPVIGLMVFIYFMDRYQKEPIGSLLKAFFGGFLSVAMDLLLVTVIMFTIGLIPILKDTVFYDSFITAGIPEELCKFAIFMIFIWRDKNFDEYFDGIVYAVFISLGFACVENIEYVFMNTETGLVTGIARAMTAVPGHMLFAIVMGYFLSLAKFIPEKRIKYIFTGLLLSMAVHGMYDWLLMANERLLNLENTYALLLAVLLYLFFLAGDAMLWIFGMKLVRKHQNNSRLQAETSHFTTN